MDATEIMHDTHTAIDSVADQLAEVLRGTATADVPIAGSEWTARDAAAHLISGTSLYCELATGATSPVLEFTPEALRRFSAQRLADIADTDPSVLAISVLDVAGQFTSLLRGRRPDAPIAWHRGIPLDLAQLAGVLLGEYVVHGYDITTALGWPWPIDPAHVGLVLHGYTPLFSEITDPVTTAGHSAGYELDLGASGQFTARFTNGQLRLEPPDTPPIDCRITADPVTFLLVSTGRLSQWTAIALGLLKATGPHAELGLNFLGLFRYP